MKDSDKTNSADNRHVTITVGRQFGSGGREIGRRLADAFGFRYYDKELLHEAAQRAGVSTEFFEKNDERFPSFLNGIFFVCIRYVAEQYICRFHLYKRRFALSRTVRFYPFARRHRFVCDSRPFVGLCAPRSSPHGQPFCACTDGAVCRPHSGPRSVAEPRKGACTR